MRGQYYVYLMASRTGVLYTGVTNNLERRVWEHRNSEHPGFARRYNVNRLVWFEAATDVQAAIAREKQIKGWKRHRKLALVEEANPTWADLSADWPGYGGRQRSFVADSAI